MRGFSFWGSHPGLRRNLCVLLTIGLIVGSFTCFINADENEEDEQAAAVEQVEVEEVAEVEAVEEPEKEAVEAEEAAGDEEAVVEEAVVEEAAVEENAAEENDEAEAEEADGQDNAAVEEEDLEDADAEIIETDTLEENVTVEADMAVESQTDIIIWAYYYSEAAEFSEIIKSHYEGLGHSVTLKKDSNPLTSSELQGVKLVYLIPWYQYPSDTFGQAVIASADVLKSFVQNGGRVLLNGERSTSFGQAILEQVSSGMGFDFSFTGDNNYPPFFFNSAERLSYAEKISGFIPSWYSWIDTSDSDAVWIIKDSQDNVIMMDKKLGSGYIIVLTDINWLGKSSDETIDNLLEGICSHIHMLSVEASDDVLTAKCTVGDCDSAALSSGVKLTIVAPEKTVVDDAKSEAASLSGLDDFNSATGLKISADDILYTGTGSTSYAESSTAPTAVGTYKASITVGGATASVEYEIEPVTYSFEDSAKSWTKDSTETLSFRASRNSNDETTINHFTGAEVDNKAVEEANMNVTAGSVIVELKAEFLNTLDVGTHTITFRFDDGDSISMSFTVKAAPKASPQTGEYAGPAILVMAAVLLAGSTAAGVKVFRKKEEI